MRVFCRPGFPGHPQKHSDNSLHVPGLSIVRTRVKFSMLKWHAPSWEVVNANSGCATVQNTRFPSVVDVFGPFEICSSLSAPLFSLEFCCGWSCLGHQQNPHPVRLVCSFNISVVGRTSSGVATNMFENICWGTAAVD